MDDLHEWWDKVDPGWSDIRGRTMELLKKEQRLEQIVRLIGPDALPDDQRLILISAELIKNGFLQQNSFDDIDKYCTPQKQMLLLQAIMQFHAKADDAVRAGVPLAKIVALPIRERLTRIKSEVPNEKLEEIRQAIREVNSQFEELQRRKAGEEAR